MRFLCQRPVYQTLKKKTQKPFSSVDISAARWQKWVNIDWARNHRQLSHPLHVIPVFQGNSLCGNRLCLTSLGDRMHLILSTWCSLLVLREINNRSATSNQALITFSMLIAVGQDVIWFCKGCLFRLEWSLNRNWPLSFKSAVTLRRQITRSVTARSYSFPSN